MANSRRRSIHIEGFAHSQPIPAASVVGNILATGGVHGIDPATGKVADDPERQVALMFQHIAAILKAAGGTTEDIIKLTVYTDDRAIRALVNKEWLAMFPDEHSRPARHTFQYAHLAAPMVVQCDVMAVLAG